MDCDLEVWVKETLSSPKSLLVSVHHNSRKESKDSISLHSIFTHLNKHLSFFLCILFVMGPQKLKIKVPALIRINIFNYKYHCGRDLQISEDTLRSKVNKVKQMNCRSNRTYHSHRNSERTVPMRPLIMIHKSTTLLGNSKSSKPV